MLCICEKSSGNKICKQHVLDLDLYSLSESNIEILRVHAAMVQS